MGLELAATERLRRGDRLAAAVCVAALVAGGVARASDTSRTVPTISSKHVAARALTPWEQAERGREELEAIPEGDRTRAQYMHALDAYRAIYHDAPGDQHAPAAVYAVAELLAEQGRGLHDRKSLEAAVGQYEFLRKQYPGSSLRVEALLAEGQIAQDDLQDAKAARAAYALLLKQYPRSAQAEEARAGLESLEQGSVAGVQGPGNRDQGSGSRGQRSANGAAEELGEPAGVGMPRAAGQQVGAVEVAPKLQVAEVHPVAAAVAQRSSSFGKRAVVTGIRHWSTATYTRVAIDLGDEVTYEAARVPNPDRIYFDLHGTKLAQDLVGKSFAVTDDGFLKRIRAAQSSDDVTRVVLDVSDVSDYSAFLLPNPYRLIIDIHGRAPGQAAPQYTEAPEGPSTLPAMPVTGASVTAAEVPAPHAAGMVRSTVAKPVPNTMTVRQANSADVAAVSQTPGRVEATTRPTSQPISAVVPGAGTTRQAAGATEAVASVTRETVVTAQGTPIEQAPATAAVPGDTMPKKSRKAAKAAVAAGSAAPARAAVPTADGETSLVRALGLKIGRIVIDAGHGGHDSGTLGADGIEEKDVVLDVALRVGKLLHDRLGAEIIYTRSDDTFIPLETRTAIANKAQADLFLSIHANSSSDATARGVETYYLNFTSDPSALETAARENAVSDQSIHQLSDLVKKIALKDKIAESREFASDVEDSLYAGLAKGNDGLKNRGVKKAPFVVLIGANMPSILAEISFVTNPRDAEQLRNPEYRERVAESLYRGVARYEAGLSGGTRVVTERAALGQ